MEFAERLSAALGEAEQGHFGGVPRVAGWRFDVTDGRQIQLGIRDNEFAGVYSPATNREGLGGGLYLIWDDGRISLSTLERRTLDEFGGQLALWRATAYVDPRAPEIAAPGPTSDVLTWDSTIAGLFPAGSERLFHVLRHVDRSIRTYGVELLDAGLTVGTGKRVVRNSRGVDVEWDSTMCSLWLSADSLYSNSYGRRVMVPDEEVERLIQDVGETSRLLKQSAELASDRMLVLLPPGIAESFVETYLVRNAAGSLVANGQSCWDRSDFENQKSIASAGFMMVIDSTRPHEPSAERCSSEGVPAGCQAIVDAGRLVTPLLDLKYAKVLNLPVTPPGGIYFTHENLSDFSELIRSTERGLLVHSVLGMHTQDPSSGNYSLTADRALVVQDGKPLGRVKAIITGNFFDDIRADATQFGSNPPDPNPGLRAVASVTVE